jgi:AcrR family transcriptional regulator
MSESSERSGAPGADDASSRIDQIAEAALRLFARYGYKRSSMDDIAKEAGLAKATLYLHFKGKDDVFRAMLKLLARRAETRCREVMAMDAPFAARLSALLHAHYGQAYASFGTGEHLVELKLVMASIAGPELQTFDQIFVDFAKRLFAEAEKAREIALAGSGVGLDEMITSLMLAAAGAKAGDPPSREIYAERLTSIAKIFAAAVAR